MKRGKIVLTLIIVAVVIGGVIVMKNMQNNSIVTQDTDDGQRATYYTCGMHPSVKVSVEEYKKGNELCPICNMKLIPVYKEKTDNENKKQPKEQTAEKKILFYRNPMNPEITSKTPAKDEMGMDYIPVYEEQAQKEELYYGCGVDTEGKCPHCDLGEPDSKCICGGHSFAIKGEKIDCPVCGRVLRKLTNTEADKLRGVVSRVKIKTEQIKRAGVQTEPVKKLELYKEIRTAGEVAYDPELVIAEEEFISSLDAMDKIEQGNIPEIKQRASRLVESSRRKLKLLGLSDEQIQQLQQSRQVHENLILPEKKMWIYADVYEYELPWVKHGSKVKVTTTSLPGEEFEGVVSSINPVVDPKTRAVRFRAQVDNPDLALKPRMYVDVIIMSMYKGADGESLVLAVPKQAVLDTGTRKIVWIDKGNDEYEGRIIQTGPEANADTPGGKKEFYPVLRGLDEGENVVTKANFLIDSQSQISGAASAAYGGALEGSSEESVPVHQH